MKFDMVTMLGVMPTGLAAIKFVAEPKILMAKSLIFHPQLFELVVFLTLTAVTDPRCCDVDKKAGDKNTQSESCQKRQHPQ